MNVRHQIYDVLNTEDAGIPHRCIFRGQRFHEAHKRVLMSRLFEGMIVTILLIELKDGVLKDPSKAGCNSSHSITSQLT